LFIVYLCSPTLPYMKSIKESKKRGIATGILILLFNYAFGQTPVEEMPLHLFSQPNNKTELIVYVTGDGGWNSFSQEMSQSFVRQGYNVVALDSKKYFWNAKTPERFTQDIERVINHYMKTWKKSTCMITGYSFGADVIAFLPHLVSPNLRAKIVLLAMVSPGISTDFEVHVSDLLSDNEPTDRKFNTKDIIQQATLPTVCIFGSEEKLRLKDELKETANLRLIELPGAHHFNHQTESIVQQILTVRNR